MLSWHDNYDNHVLFGGGGKHSVADENVCKWQTNESTWKHILNNLSLSSLPSACVKTMFKSISCASESRQKYTKSFSRILTVKACNDGFFLQKLFSWGKLLSLTVQMLLLSKIWNHRVNLGAISIFHVSCCGYFLYSDIFFVCCLGQGWKNSAEKRLCCREGNLYTRDQARDREKAS